MWGQFEQTKNRNNMKKNNLILVLLCLACAWACVGQPQDGRDFRAELNLLGGFPVFTLAPDGTCWLTSGSGHVYYTETIHSDWHSATPFFHTSIQRDSLPAWTDINQISFLDISDNRHQYRGSL